MPGFLAHYLFSEHSLDLLKRKELEKAIEKHKTVFYLGAQGPDIFYYYLPCNVSEKKKLGTKMHRTSTNAFFQSCIRHLHAIHTPIEEEIVLAYVTGFLCHYTLDTLTHPYIYARSEYAKYQKTPLNNSARHCSFETFLDTNLLYHYYKQLPSSINYSKIITLPRQEITSLAKYLSKVIKDTYFVNEKKSYVTEGFIRRAIHAMPLELRILKDRSGKKKAFVKWVENKTIKYHLLSSLISVDELHRALDVLNHNKKSWGSPWRPEEVRNETFLDLYEKALPVAAKRMDELYCLSKATLHPLHYEKKLADFLTDLGNCSYNTGIPCDETM